MRLKLLYELKEIPEVNVDDYPLDDEENETDVGRSTKLKKRFVHRPMQAMAGELNKETHTPISPTAFVGAATTR